MGTIADKLTYLNGTKQAIKQAINEDFEVIDNNTTFREYADEISSNNAKYKDLIPKETINATNALDISNSANLKALVTQYGNTYQETTTGKNLLNTSSERQAGYSTTINGITFTINEDNTITANGTVEGTENARFTFIDNTSILGTNKKITSQLINGEINGQCSFFAYDNTYGNARSSQVATDGSVNNTALGTNIEYTKFRLTVYAGATVNNAKIGLMVIDTSETDYTYEPYTNGASPNPDYPQEIVNISGKSTLKDVGKNLYSGSNVLTDRFTYIIPSKIGETYTLSFKGSTTETGGSARVFLRNCNDIEHTSSIDNQFISLTSTMTNYSLTLTPTGNGYLFMVIAGSVSKFTFENIMLEKASTVSTYEPYQEQSFDLDLKSKNLFDKDNANTLVGYVSSTKISGSSQTKTLYIPCKPNTTYTISKISSSRFAVGTTVNTPVVNETVVDYSANNTSTSITITTSSNTNYLCVFYYHSTYDTTITEQQILDSIQIEENSSTTEYESYYDINLCKIGDYKDRIYPLNGKWYLEKKIGKISFSDSDLSSCSVNGISSAFVEYLSPIIDDIKPSINEASQVSFSNITNMFRGTTSTKKIRFRISHEILGTTSASTNAEAKTALLNKMSDKTMICYYVLATPTTTEITESNYPTLYNQLNNIKLYEGVNHLTFTNESGLDVEFDIEYYKNWKLD